MVAEHRTRITRHCLCNGHFVNTRRELKNTKEEGQKEELVIKQIDRTYPCKSEEGVACLPVRYSRQKNT